MFSSCSDIAAVTSHTCLCLRRTGPASWTRLIAIGTNPDDMVSMAVRLTDVAQRERISHPGRPPKRSSGKRFRSTGGDPGATRCKARSACCDGDSK
ncbi:uncharacterized protein SCHCODRAFT_02639887 [Schizophyllum commune H4-8]|uniref:uncharacterized protein n=1 Tax=Schizophyllum commune (strain H4-8 / FGSC 9210) TaxID=578458 RepID=UPI002160BFF7|nr:uncharacterized protein SCHCODRAFT_02639887 [Schizophyllum commune H4-8]KAI5886814.1 hypothetical protein SCHCODRAFT_02639887 [Schizophyllum commune H4-8]